MKYLKGFKDLFESEEEMEEIHPRPLNLFTRDDVE